MSVDNDISNWKSLSFIIATIVTGMTIGNNQQNETMLQIYNNTATMLLNNSKMSKDLLDQQRDDHAKIEHLLLDIKNSSKSCATNR